MFFVDESVNLFSFFLFVNEQILECLLVAASELGGLMNEEFVEYFGITALTNLPPMMLREYIDRGIVVVSMNLIGMMIVRKYHIRNPEFFYFVVSKVPGDEIWAVLDYMEKRKIEIPFYLLQYFAKRNYWIFMKDLHPDISCCDGSKNIPLQLLSTSVATEIPLDDLQPVPPEPLFSLLLTRFSNFDLNYQQIHFPKENPPPPPPPTH